MTWRQRRAFSTVLVGLISVGVLMLASCRCGKGYVRADAIEPSVEAMSERLEELTLAASTSGEMTATEAEAVLAEIALLRAVLAAATAD